jgi:hypothetical protein
MSRPALGPAAVRGSAFEKGPAVGESRASTSQSWKASRTAAASRAVTPRARAPRTAWSSSNVGISSTETARRPVAKRTSAYCRSTLLK